MIWLRKDRINRFLIELIYSIILFLYIVKVHDGPNAGNERCLHEKPPLIPGKKFTK